VTAARAFSSPRAVVDWLGTSPRRVWWTSFVLVASLSGLWGLANPPFAAPDEPSHLIRAIALDHGQLTGTTPTRRQVNELGLSDRGDYLIVRVPEIYANGGASAMHCLAHRPFRSAACLRFEGSTSDVDAGTYVARHPPAYYGAVGAVSWILPTGKVTLYAMRFVGSVITAAFIATAVTALRRLRSSRLVAVALAVAITPMVLFVSSSVNPSSPEIASGIAFWVCGLVLIWQARDRIDNRLVTATGIAGCVLVLSRQLGPLWLVFIVLAMIGVGNRDALRNLAGATWARAWGVAVAASAVVQLGWDVLAKPLDVSRSGHAPAHIPAAEIIRISLGQAFDRYWEMIGWFGWLDTPSPALVWVPWTLVLGALVFLAVLWATRRHVAVLLAVLAATIVVPVAIEGATYTDAGSLTWQGRYTLPFAVGVPILAGFTLSLSERGRQIANRRLVLCIGAALGVAQIIAFAQNLRRYTVGHYGVLQFWKHALWSPPLSPLLLTIAFIITTSAFMWWLLAIVPNGVERTELTAPESDPRHSRSGREVILTSPGE
jgi:hypothetical protein